MTQDEIIKSLLNTYGSISSNRTSFLISTLPPTVNHSYGFNGKRRYLKPEVVNFKHQVFYETRPEARIFRPKKIMAMVTLFHSNDWITKVGEPKRRDIDNMMKSLLDAVSLAFEFDDKLIFQAHQFKLSTTTKFTKVYLFELK